jgi:hypothetical protein
LWARKGGEMKKAGLKEKKKSKKVVLAKARNLSVERDCKK